MIKIANKSIGNKQPCFIIAEAGVNHNGDIDLAKKLIDAAVEAGVDAVKFQTWITEDLVTKNAPKANYQLETTGGGESQFEMIKKLELSFEEFKVLKKYCDKKNIIFLSTPDEEKSVDFLQSIDVPAFKLSSGELTNFRMLKKIAKQGKPIILSVGMSTISQIRESIQILEDYGSNNIIILHCNVNYPTENKDVNLRVITTLKEEFNYPIGFSDHTMSVEVPVASVALGAMVVEKHFTLDRNMEGPDHSSSLEPNELKNMVEMIRSVEVALGSPEKIITESEMGNIGVMRKVIVASRDLKKGKILDSSDIVMKRAGEGLEPKHESMILGMKLTTSLLKDGAVTLEILENGI